MKVGDTVRYLNAVGGGIVTRISGQTAYVDEDGFETPMLVKDLVVVAAAGHNSGGEYNTRLVFDQKAVDAVKARDKAERRAPELSKEIKTEPEPPKEIPVIETEHGDKLTLALAFEPEDIRRLTQTSFAAILVNDSNYFLHFTFLRRGSDQRAWQLVYEGTVEPNMTIDLCTLTHAELPGYERVALQALAYKKDKPFELKAPVNFQRRLDLKKFYKAHCFRPGVYFDSPVLEVPVQQADAPAVPEPDLTPLTQPKTEKSGRQPFRKRNANPADNPNKLLPLVEVDLHADELLPTLAGMESKDILEYQLGVVRKTMEQHRRRLGQKIVFIHGKGDGVLRDAVRKLLRNKYAACTWQDASFREYGFGATLVTVHATEQK